MSNALHFRNVTNAPSANPQLRRSGLYVATVVSNNPSPVGATYSAIVFSHTPSAQNPDEVAPDGAWKSHIHVSTNRPLLRSQTPEARSRTSDLGLPISNSALLRLRVFALINFAMPPDLTIVTGASSNHFLPLQSLLWTIAKFEPTARVIAYDLGLTRDEHAYLAHTPPFYLPNWELRTFDFEKYPGHFAIEVEAGRMAFRPTILAAIAHEFGTRNTQHGTLRSVPLSTINFQPSTALLPRSTLNTKSSQLLWLDSGCQLREPLDELRACITRDGVYSPCAPGTIENCLHPASHSALSVTSDLLKLPIRDAGICGFDLSNVAAVCDRRKNITALLTRWSEIALNKNATAPEASTRRTHRQDAVFAVLLNQAARANHWILETKRLRGLAIKQDHLTPAETKFRTALGPPASRWQVSKL
jgi:uncharacterized protein DUF1647